MDLKTVGQNIKKYRIEKGIKQEALAEMADLTPNYIGMLERGDKTPSLILWSILQMRLESHQICFYATFLMQAMK